MFSILSIGCFSSSRCWANLDFLLSYLKSLRCSWNLVLHGLPVWPVYFLLQDGHVNWYTPDFSYLFLVWFCFVRSFSIVLSVLNATFMPKLLKFFLIYLVSLPTYVNFAHFVFPFSSVSSMFCFWLCGFPFVMSSMMEGSYLLYRVFFLLCVGGV
jgi:hypothetical protein